MSAKTKAQLVAELAELKSQLAGKETEATSVSNEIPRIMFGSVVVFLCIIGGKLKASIHKGWNNYSVLSEADLRVYGEMGTPWADAVLIALNEADNLPEFERIPDFIEATKAKKAASKGKKKSMTPLERAMARVNG